jgi:phosphoribosylformylglycinamidine synthase II
MPADPRLLAALALSPDEYALIVQRLGREPNEVELGMFGALWSEHCGYKNSKLLLRRFPNDIAGIELLVPPGQENAGVVDLGDGLALVMKIESHNHPSAIEPYQGAATGVGGIVRDIFALGARPIALLDSLRFGPLDLPRNRYLFGGVVGGIGGYGNCLGLPTVAGEVYFEPGYTHNPLVNAMCIGILAGGRLVRARADGPGNLIVLVGADTGRDGIGGANVLASRTFDERSEELRPTVQVGNPFLEKLLMEACHELAQAGLLVGMQDLGAAGLTSALSECAARAGTGVEVDVLAVPRREAGMVPYEVMLSESQERMLLFVRPEHEAEVRERVGRYGLQCAVIGRVTEDGLVRVKEGERVVAELPAKVLTDPPLYRREGVESPEAARLRMMDLSQVPETIGSAALGHTLLRLLASPNLASREPVYRQYDHQVLTNTVIGPGGDAALLRIKGTKKAIAVTADGNGRYCYLDPYVGGALAVAEAARNILCTGARPLAITDCLNFGNPEKPEVYYQLEQCIEGMAMACRALGVPVVSGNVSLYNETNGQAVWPTPVVGMAGLLDDVERRCQSGFRAEGHLVLLLGDDAGDVAALHDALDGEPEDLAGSEYLKEVHGIIAGQPRIDLELEARVQRCVLEAQRQGLLRSCHDCAEGGVAIALAEAALFSGLGFRLDAPVTGRADAALFGERPSRFIVTAAVEDFFALQVLAGSASAGLASWGATGSAGTVSSTSLSPRPRTLGATAWSGPWPGPPSSVLPDQAPKLLCAEEGPNRSVDHRADWRLRDRQGA